MYVCVCVCALCVHTQIYKYPAAYIIFCGIFTVYLIYQFPYVEK